MVHFDGAFPIYHPLVTLFPLKMHIDICHPNGNEPPEADDGIVIS
jgi:hypothetical protein